MKATVKLLKDAKAGDFLWLHLGDKHLHSADGRYLGRGVWQVTKVIKVARVYITVEGDVPGSEAQFEIETGLARASASGFRPNDRACGATEKWQQCEAAQVKAAVMNLGDIDKLIRIAAILGIAPPEVA